MSREGLRVEVDGQGCLIPGAGIGVYTSRMLEALRRQAPQATFNVWVPASLGERDPSWRELPSFRFVGRHLVWPGRLRPGPNALYWGPAGSTPLRPPPMPSVITVHDLAIYREPAWFPRGQWLSVKVVVPRSIRKAQRVIAVSASTAADVQSLFSVEAERIDVVPEGVSPAFAPLPREELEAARRRLNLPDRFILFVGTIEPRKNVGTLLDAWARLADRPPLVLAGGWGWRSQELRSRLERRSQEVVCLGPVASRCLPPLYNLATCLVHPSWFEGFGLTPLEAMACGTPVISSNTSSMPEVVGDAACLVSPADVEGWTAALERVLGDPELRASMRAQGLERARGFTWERAAERTLATFAAALTRSSA